MMSDQQIEDVNQIQENDCSLHSSNMNNSKEIIEQSETASTPTLEPIPTNARYSNEPIIFHYQTNSTTGNDDKFEAFKCDMSFLKYENDDYDFDKSTLQSLTAKPSIPKYNPIFVLFLGLILSTTLALLAAFDAANNCAKGNNKEGGYYEEEGAEAGDDDNSAQRCKSLFTIVIVPVCAIVLIISAICCNMTLRSDQRWKMGGNTIPPTIELTGIYDGDRKRFDEFRAYVENQRQHLRSIAKLGVLSFICFSLWSYAEFMILDDSDEPIDDNNEQQNRFKLQFQSLGALNYLGEVGKNANLYYSSWISVFLTIALVYELVCITYKQYTATSNLESELAVLTRHMFTHTREIEMIMTWSTSQQQLVKVKRSTWHESLHKLRFRAGYWLVVLIASCMIYFSSSRVWRNDMTMANGYYDDDFNSLCTIWGGFTARDDLGLLHPSKCERTKTSIATGIICVVLSLAALASHYHFYKLISKEMESSSILNNNKESHSCVFEKKKKLVPLRMECLFAFALTILLAYNAIFVTAVEGPGNKVGNLYYSSWISFVMSMLITLGCLEDILDQDDEEDLLKEHDDSARPPISRWLSVKPIKEKVSTRLIMLPSSHDSSNSDSGENRSLGSYIGGMPIPTQNSLHQLLEEKFVHEEESSRSIRLRRWASGCIFSSIYLVSALDAAFHISYGQLDLVQMYMVICPCIFLTFCFMMFCLCVLDYKIVDTFYVGGTVSMFLMSIWVGNLIFTLHTASSWAVNEIGEIENANLYYFTWATTLNTGFLSSSYLKQAFDKKPKGLMVSFPSCHVLFCLSQG